MENISFHDCYYFEISFDNNTKKEYNSEEEEENEEEENKNHLFDAQEITKIFETDKTTSFNVKISTFIDLESDND